MWYNINIRRLATYLLPPILRGNILTAITDILCLPFKWLHTQFLAFRQRSEIRLRITASVMHLERAIGEALHLPVGEVYITSPDDERTHIFYFCHEAKGKPRYVRKVGEVGKPYFVRSGDGATPQHNFVVHVPRSLTSEVYAGVYLQRIQEIVNQYKPAGRSYRIDIYDNE